MERQRGHFTLHGLRRSCATLFAGVVASIVVSGCGNLFQRACQPASAPVRTLEDATWRLVYTNDPGSRYRSYDFIYSFEILAFDRQFGFNVKRVIRNRQFNAPIFQGTYDTDGAGTLVMQYQQVSAPQDDGSGDNQPTTTNLGTVQYHYSLGSHLELQSYKTGYIYRYVQFVGVVSPSVACVFK